MLLRFVQARDLMELARRARSAVLQVPGLSPCPPLDFAEVYSQIGSRERATTISPNRRRNCANGKSVSPAIGNICAGRFVSRRQTPGLLSSGKKNLRRCEMDLRRRHVRRGRGAA